MSKDSLFAFPQPEYGWTQGYNGGSDKFIKELTGGMTLRDYFAAKALPVAMSTPWRDIGYVPADSLDDMRQHARCAYQMADAMLAERAK